MSQLVYRCNTVCQTKKTPNILNLQGLCWCSQNIQEWSSVSTEYKTSSTNTCLHMLQMTIPLLKVFKRVDCSQSPIFPWDHGCRSLSLTGRHLGLLMRAKLERVQNARRWGWWRALTPTATTHGHFVLSPVLFASRDQGGGPSNSTIDIYDLTEK